MTKLNKLASVDRSIAGNDSFIMSRMPGHGHHWTSVPVNEGLLNHFFSQQLFPFLLSDLQNHLSQTKTRTSNITYFPPRKKKKNSRHDG